MNYDHNLGHLFDFNGDNLTANRAGQLSSAQLQRFKGQHRGCLHWGWAISLVLAALTVIAYLTAQSTE